MKKEDTKMKDTTYTKKLAYMGAGCGVVLFAVFGLLPGSFLGGVMGLNIAGIMFGTPVGAGLLPKDDRSSLDGGWGDGIRDDVHHGINDPGLADRHDSGCDKDRE